MGDPRGAERKARQRKCKLNMWQFLVWGVFWGLAGTSLSLGRPRASSTCHVPRFLPPLCAPASLQAVKDKSYLRAELHNLFGRAIFTRDRSFLPFPVQSHEEWSHHVCESRVTLEWVTPGQLPSGTAVEPQAGLSRGRMLRPICRAIDPCGWGGAAGGMRGLQSSLPCRAKEPSTQGTWSSKVLNPLQGQRPHGECPGLHHCLSQGAFPDVRPDPLIMQSLYIWTKDWMI